MKVITTTVDNQDSAEKIAQALLTEKLVACVNFFPVKSVYTWKSKIENSEETLLRIKTKQSLVTETINKIKEVHPYDLPVIEVINTETNEKVKEWIDEVVKNG